MDITKYEHACLVIDIDGDKLVIDPGAYTTDLDASKHIVAIVITHEHHDHIDTDLLKALIAQSPDAVVYADKTVLENISAPHKKPVAAGESFEVGPFSLRFTGGAHAVIHPSFPPMANIGVVVNDNLYYPGDSFASPDGPVKNLALPVAAPWLKLSESIDFLRSIQPSMVFPTHDAILSDTGKKLVDTMIGNIAKDLQLQYERIDGKTITLKS
ncbi:MAG: putative Zn-dependent hydrolase [Candidatus Saccharibacteria bacterium]|nr:putative Zn-dependent hydrolase [Candidatus Saccharibacteria bacterium]